MDEVIPRECLFLNEKTGEVDNWDGIEDTAERSINDKSNDSVSSDIKENCAGISSVDSNKQDETKSDSEVSPESNNKDESDHKYDGPSAESIEILKQQITKLEEKINTENKEKNSVEENNETQIDCAKETQPEPSAQNEAAEKSSIEENADKSEETDKCEKTTESQDSIEEIEADKSKGDDEFNEDDDFDPSLLCPEVSMDVDESLSINPSTSSTDNPVASTPEATCSTFIDVMTGAEVNFDITAEEQELRGRLFGENNPVEFTKIHCTACNIHLGSALDGQGNRFVHPLLKVIICKDCYHFYTSGEFVKDEDGSELYCRWCGQGGQVVCCSKCEFVFCNRCIRNNFGRKKVAEIKNSDNWLCFRCNQSQLCALRIACYEFFEYIKHQMSKTSTDDTKWSTDYCRCCSGKKREKDNEDSEVNRAKKRRRVNDPDYYPIEEKEEYEQENDLPSLAPLTAPKPLITIAKPANTLMSNFVLNPISTIPAGMGFRAILPSNISQLGIPITFSDNAAVPPLLPTLKFKKTFESGKKHEWFNKTVRASTRVNSQLTVTLNQLNQAQTRATTVEELAVIHNKLQEVLSSSINSLIQIRRNLRTEFITGIKAVRVTPKPPESPTLNQNIDDDVILVSAPDSMPVPSTSQPIILKKQLIRKIPAPSLSLLKPPPSGGFIKVKPMSDLQSQSQSQSVATECITIPDDEPVEPLPKKPSIKVRSPSTLKSIESLQTIINKCITANSNSNIENTPGNSRDSKTIFKKSAKHVVKTALPTKSFLRNIAPKTEKSVFISADKKAKLIETNSCKDVTNIRYDVKEKPSKTIKKMLSVTVRLEKMDTLLESKMLNGYSKVK